jgi:hypothetical protein
MHINGSYLCIHRFASCILHTFEARVDMQVKTACAPIHSFFFRSTSMRFRRSAATLYLLLTTSSALMSAASSQNDMGSGCLSIVERSLRNKHAQALILTEKRHERQTGFATWCAFKVCVGIPWVCRTYADLHPQLYEVK